MSKTPDEIGLSPDEVSQLAAVRFGYAGAVKIGTGSTAEWMRGHVCNYLSALLTGAASENIKKKGLAKESRSGRVDALFAFGNALKRTPKADDILEELRSVIEVPDSITDAIRRDVERLA